MSLDSAIEFPPAPKLFTPDDLHEDDSHTKPRLSVDSDDSGIQFREYDSPDVVSEPRHHRSHLHHLHLPHHHSRHHSRHRPKKKRDSFERPPSSRSGETEAFASVIAYAERKRRRREAVARNILQLEERRKKDEAYALSSYFNESFLGLSKSSSNYILYIYIFKRLLSTEAMLSFFPNVENMLAMQLTALACPCHLPKKL